MFLSSLYEGFIFSFIFHNAMGLCTPTPILLIQDFLKVCFSPSFLFNAVMIPGIEGQSAVSKKETHCL